MSGRVILLHGTSSSGKTTITRAIQELSDEPWLRLGIDAFWNAVHETSKDGVGESTSAEGSRHALGPCRARIV